MARSTDPLGVGAVAPAPGRAGRRAGRARRWGRRRRCRTTMRTPASGPPRSRSDVVHQGEVAVLDALLDHGARDGEEQPVAVEADGDGVLEGGAPDGVGHLLAQGLLAGAPQVLCVSHLPDHPPASTHVHSEHPHLWKYQVRTVATFPQPCPASSCGPAVAALASSVDRRRGSNPGRTGTVAPAPRPPRQVWRRVRAAPRRRHASGLARLLWVTAAPLALSRHRRPWTAGSLPHVSRPTRCSVRSSPASRVRTARAAAGMRARGGPQ